MNPVSFSGIPEIVSGDWAARIPRKDGVKKRQKKQNLTVFWSTTEPLVEEWLPDHGAFNSTYFGNVVLPRLTNIVFANQVRWCRQRVYLHMDNAISHNSKGQPNTSTAASLKRCPIYHIRRILHSVTFTFLKL
jgi:hypothetical protein